MAVELERPVINILVPVPVEPDVLESPVIVASAEPSIELRNRGERTSEVVIGIDADIAAAIITDEAFSIIAAPVAEPAVISTR